MSGKDIKERKLWAVPLHACAIWLAAAGVLLFVSGLVLAHSTGSSRQMAYASSAVSFLAAVPVGWFLGCQMRGKRLVLSLLAGLALCLLLLLAGFLIDAHSISSDAILSLSSFTLAGTMAGSLPGDHRGGKGRGRRTVLRKHSRYHT